MARAESIYLDYAAATPVDPRVADAMAAALRAPDAFANPSAMHHAPGRAAHEYVERARARVAALINASPQEIVWTSGATESNNLAIIGAARFRRGVGRHVVSAATEHASVLESVRHLESEGFAITLVQPDPRGVVTAEIVADALRDDTILVSIMHVNNEIGVVQDIAAIGALCRARDVLFHVDAAQSAGREPIDVAAQGVDLMSLSAQKVYGPKGVGALYLSRERARRVEPLMHGGGQERGLRPGTIPTHQVIGMGEAFALAATEREQDVAHIGALCDRLWSRLSSVGDIVLNGAAAARSCHILCVSVPGVHGESLLHGLEQRGIAISAGAACVTRADEPSAVLRSLGHSPELAQASVRFSLGRWSSGAEIDAAGDAFCEVVADLRRIAPAADRPASARVAGGTLIGAAGTRSGGVDVEFRVRVAPGDARIGDVEFRAYGCPHTIAACRWLGEHLAGLPVSALREVAPEALMTAVAVPIEKRGRMLVVQDALRNCFAAWDNTKVCQ